MFLSNQDLTDFIQPSANTNLLEDYAAYCGLGDIDVLQIPDTERFFIVQIDGSPTCIPIGDSFKQSRASLASFSNVIYWSEQDFKKSKNFHEDEDGLVFFINEDGDVEGVDCPFDDLDMTPEQEEGFEQLLKIMHLIPNTERVRDWREVVQ